MLETPDVDGGASELPGRGIEEPALDPDVVDVADATETVEDDGCLTVEGS